MTPEWIAVDWGTSNLRAWAMQGDTPVAEVVSDKGMGSLAPDAFESALLEVIEPWLDAPKTVVACGMVGAKQGWCEAPYIPVPAKPTDAAKIITAPAKDPRISVQILPGMSQATPADVMRGEETQIAGLIAQKPDFDGVVCLPGTHTKWARISAEEVVNFQTYMTGELFALLSKQSVLRHSVGEGWDDDAFTDALSNTISRPESFAAKAFSLRAESLLADLTPATSRARLSGMLIGMELAAARQYWLGQHVAIIGDQNLSKTYQSALATQGLQAELLDAQTLTLAGLTAAYRSLT